MPFTIKRWRKGDIEFFKCIGYAEWVGAQVCKTIIKMDGGVWACNELIW